MSHRQDLTAFGLENRTYTIEEWQAIEARTGERFEFIDGRLINWRAMAGGTREHALLSTNFTGAMFRRFTADEARYSHCNAYSSDLQLKLPEGRKYVYPDAAIVCGEPVYDEVLKTAVQNPVVVAEVLSESSFQYDTGKKFEYYAALESLREYVLIRQDEYVVETRSRTEPGGPWQIVFAHERDHVAVLPTLELELPLTELYRGIRFDWEDEEEAAA